MRFSTELVLLCLRLGVQSLEVVALLGRKLTLPFGDVLRTLSVIKTGASVQRSAEDL